MRRSHRSRGWGRHLAALHIWGISVGEEQQEEKKEEEEERLAVICAHVC